MIEIIPNVHPIFVHFTVALFTISVIFYTLSFILNKIQLAYKLAYEIEIVAKWCLWVVGVLVIGTVIAGLQAYNTVKHDAPSHLAMTDHRNWAFVTASGIIIASIWSGWKVYKHKKMTLLFMVYLLFVQSLLMITAWKGAELVFRYGLGVISLPQSENKGHIHHHETEINNRHEHQAHDHHTH